MSLDAIENMTLKTQLLTTGLGKTWLIKTILTWLIRVGWWISKVGENGVKWKLLGIETAVVKGFFSKIIILDNRF